MRFSDWTPANPEPAQIVDLRPEGVLLGLARYYEGTRPAVVHEALGQAYSLGAQTAVIEFRYLDPDYRSEHSRFYSTTFRRYPSVAHRLHFFSSPPPDEWRDPERSLDFTSLDASYLGFVVMRPLPGARVGRVALAAHDDLVKDVTCITREHVNVFGAPMSIRAAPFMAQDAQLGVCAHMALWVVAQHHHLAYGRARCTAAEVAELIPTDLGLGRPAPSSGLTVEQLAAGCRALGLPALVYKCKETTDLPAGEKIPGVACRYLNSGMPVIVAAGGHHAFTLVGYRRVDAGTKDERIHFIRQDDEIGPYQVVEDFAHDLHGKWEWLIVPLPSKVFVPGEIAESLGSEQILETASHSPHPAAQDLVAETADPTNRAVSFRSTVVRSNQFKASLVERGFVPEAAALYRRLPLPRWIWVVEAIRKDEREQRAYAVVAEAVIDATDHSRDMHVLAWRVPGALWTWRPDEDEVGDRDLPDQPLVDSVARYTADERLLAQPT
ncbi:MAG: hypothetical protein H0W70_00140 [Actinobacteria bacterium]|nr:hypothetical protein [Actinomycetota bacterium]